MRFKFDKKKSAIIKLNPKRGIGLDEVQEIWAHSYYQDYRNDDPEQFRAIGWVNAKLYSVIFEIREDEKGEYYHLITLWKSTKEEIRLYEKNS
jgi:uncharacterized DUF497 family protein